MSTQWPERALGEICVLNYGKALPAANRTGQGFPVYGSNGVVGQHEVGLTDGPSIVVGRKGSLGEVHYSPGPCWPIDTTYFIDRASTEADLRWLAYRLPAMGLTNLNKAAAIPGLNREDAYRQRLLVPPIGEQRRIAAVLDQAEELRAKRKDALALLDSVSAGIIAEAIDGASQVQLGDGLVFLTSGARGWAKHYRSEGSRFIRSLDVQMGSIGDDSPVYVDAPDTAEARRIQVRSDDVLLTITGSLIGRVSVVTRGIGTAYVSQHVAILRLDPSIWLPEFIAAYLALPSGGQRQIQSSYYGQTKPGLNFVQIRAFKIPDLRLSDQKQVVQQLVEVAQLQQRVRFADAASSELFSSLQHRAFAGQL